MPLRHCHLANLWIGELQILHDHKSFTCAPHPFPTQSICHSTN